MGSINSQNFGKLLEPGLAQIFKEAYAGKTNWEGFIDELRIKKPQIVRDPIEVAIERAVEKMR